jgi:predicted RNase H-like nuclease
MNRIAGVDGCRAGWMTIWRETPDGAFRFHVFATLVELERALPDLVALAIDMPIGLPDRIDGSGRAPEKAVRPLLGQRQSSVFSIPARAAVEAEDYGEACRRAFAASDPPRKVAKQGFNLFPKIRELDRFLRARPAMVDRVVETHPELVFRRIRGEPLAKPKKLPEGRAERLGLLAQAGLPPALLAASPPHGAGADDLLDAMACWLTAERHARGEAIPYPAQPSHDRFGLPIAIWA